MASIFTYDPDPPRVASPWSEAAEKLGKVANDPGGGGPQALRSKQEPRNESKPGAMKITRLQAEPQEGPVEYKLHLLLRPRRKFRSTSTGSHVLGVKQPQFANVQPNRSASESALVHGSVPSSTGYTHQTRQHRLEQLTTQLLWRLQQSSAHHTSSATNFILPMLPEALPELQAPRQPAKLLHGLEESQGALYEIGVSDDGSLIGLAEDEMAESLNNLRAMAGCLGCTVEVLRMEQVGDCEWTEETTAGDSRHRSRRSGRLVVAEAFVQPHLQSKSPSPLVQGPACDNSFAAPPITSGESSKPSTEQVRITLTGPTMCGKSTLLGTLTTSTLDNGRGKSRLSMLRHRHEITSGVTSSVTQELLGYRDLPDETLEVVNYAVENVASWIDVHVAAAGNRLVFISDSAGHPRYRRTTLRGLVGWAPHWTLLCIPADDTQEAVDKAGSTYASQQMLGPPVSGMDLSGAQLDLCLRLNLPLVVVITKLDLASRTGLRESLSKVLDALKAAGRKPVIFPNKPGAVLDEDLHFIPASLLEGAYTAAVPLLNDPTETVPIVLTSAVDGTGIGNLHALLHELPVPAAESQAQARPHAIFDVEDIYSKPADVVGVIVSGRLRAGSISVGDYAFVGPFALHDDNEDSEDSDERSVRKSTSHLPASRSFPGALRNSHLTASYLHLPNQEWRRVKIVSVRNLRLPVLTLFADQVGTVAIALDETAAAAASPTTLARIRKGMVLADVQPRATRTFTARFKREDLESLAVGNSVVVYVSSVRASARVISARAPDSPDASSSPSDRHGSEPFALDDVEASLPGLASGRVAPAPALLVTLAFDASKEYITVGDRVLVMPGGGPGLYGGHERGEKGIAGLDGFVGEILDVRG